MSTFYDDLVGSIARIFDLIAEDGGYTFEKMEESEGTWRRNVAEFSPEGTDLPSFYAGILVGAWQIFGMVEASFDGLNEEVCAAVQQHAAITARFAEAARKATCDEIKMKELGL